MRIFKYAEGTFDGIAWGDVDEPGFVEVCYYNTTRHGVLAHFILMVPNNARVEHFTVYGSENDWSEYYEININNTKYYFKVYSGNAHYPGRGRIITKEEFLKAREDP